MSNRHHIRRGSAVLETALVLPLLLSLTFGLIEFGFFFFVKHTVQNASREGVRAGVVPSAGTSEVTAAVQNALDASGFDTSLFNISVKVNGVVADPATAKAGDALTVDVGVPWGTIGVRPLGLIGAERQVRSASVMRREG